MRHWSSTSIRFPTYTTSKRTAAVVWQYCKREMPSVYRRASLFCNTKGAAASYPIAAPHRVFQEVMGMRDTVFVVTEQWADKSEEVIHRLIQQVVSAWLVKELEK